jgi:DNA-binding NtrC family response regulator
VENDDGLHVAPGTSLADVERQLITRTVNHWSRNKKEAARILGISAKTLYNRLKEYDHDGRTP